MDGAVAVRVVIERNRVDLTGGDEAYRTLLLV